MSHSSAQHAPELPHALYSANNYATTIRYSLYNAPLLPRRISDCGRQKRYPAIRSRLGAPTRNVSSSGAWPDCEEQEMEGHITQLTLSGDFNLVFTRIQQPIIPAPLTFHGQFDELRSPHRPFLVSKMTNFGTQDTIVYHFWYTKRPFLVT